MAFFARSGVRTVGFLVLVALALALGACQRNDQTTALPMLQHDRVARS